MLFCTRSWELKSFANCDDSFPRFFSLYNLTPPIFLASKYVPCMLSRFRFRAHKGDDRGLEQQRRPRTQAGPSSPDSGREAFWAPSANQEGACSSSSHYRGRRKRAPQGMQEATMFSKRPEINTCANRLFTAVAGEATNRGGKKTHANGRPRLYLRAV